MEKNKKNFCLNPCSNGIDFDQKFNIHRLIFVKFCLNPCYNGIDLDQIINHIINPLLKVLILVIME